MSLYLSASAINDYISCPQRFWYRLSKSREAEQSLPMQIGNIVHRVLELANEWETVQDGLIVASTYLDEFGLSGYDVNNLAPYLTIFNNNYRLLLSDNDLVEHSFKVLLQDDIYLVGKFDRVLINSGTFIDWKTSKKLPKNLSNSPQFIIYYEEFKSIFGKIPSSGILASLSEPAMIPYVRVEERVSVLYNEVIPRIIEDWKQKRFFRLGFYNNACHQCAFKTYCYEQLGIKDELDSRDIY